MFHKSKPVISLSEMPNIIATVVYIVILGTLLGFLGYSIVELNKLFYPVVEEYIPSEAIPLGYFGGDHIKIRHPQMYSVVENPIMVLGKADVYEANVRIRIKETGGEILYDGFATAEGAYDKLYPFKKEIAYDLPSLKEGSVEFFQESPKDGSELYKVTVPVIFKNYNDLSGWLIYRNDGKGYRLKYPQSAVIRRFENGSRWGFSYNYEKSSKWTDDFIVTAAENEENIELDKWISKNEVCVYDIEKVLKKSEKIMVAGEESVKIEDPPGICPPGAGSRISIKVYIPHNSKIYTLEIQQVGGDASSRDRNMIFNQMLESFEFLKKRK